MSIDGESLKQLHSKPLLIVTAICLAAAVWFAYLWSTSLQRKDVNFDTEIAEYRQLHRDEMSALQKECDAIKLEYRKKLDSIETHYFKMVTFQHTQIKDMAKEVDNIKKVLSK